MKGIRIVPSASISGDIKMKIKASSMAACCRGDDIKADIREKTPAITDNVPIIRPNVNHNDINARLVYTTSRTTPEVVSSQEPRSVVVWLLPQNQVVCEIVNCS